MILDIFMSICQAVLVVVGLMVGIGFATDNLFNLYRLLGELGFTITQARTAAIALGVVVFAVILGCRIKKRKLT